MAQGTCSIDGCDRSDIHGHGLCRKHYLCWRNHGDPCWERKTYDECVVDGCRLAPRSRTAQWCEKHYGRWRRNGDPAKLVTPPGPRKTDRGYVLVPLNVSHPLAEGTNSRWVYEHRLVAYELHDGRCPSQCEWCGEPFKSWSDVHVDHLNYQRGDNHPDNLRCSCRSCNIGRHEGCDLDSWAQSMAARRILRLHRDQYLAEIERMKKELAHVPSRTATQKVRASNHRRAVQSSAR